MGHHRWTFLVRFFLHAFVIFASSPVFELLGLLVALVAEMVYFSFFFPSFNSPPFPPPPTPARRSADPFPSFFPGASAINFVANIYLSCASPPRRGLQSLYPWVVTFTLIRSAGRRYANFSFPLLIFSFPPSGDRLDWSFLPLYLKGLLHSFT